jgi:hypothetical protein
VSAAPGQARDPAPRGEWRGPAASARSRPSTGAVAVAIALAALAALLALGSGVPPLRVECPAGGMSEEACRETVDGSLKRGLRAPHPLILAARVEPGPAGLDEYGHRATVRLDLLGVPGPTHVRMYYDRGGHWGGEVDRPDAEILAWFALPPLVLVTAAGLVLALARRRPRRD